MEEGERNAKKDRGGKLAGTGGGSKQSGVAVFFGKRRSALRKTCRASRTKETWAGEGGRVAKRRTWDFRSKKARGGFLKVWLRMRLERFGGTRV